MGRWKKGVLPGRGHKVVGTEKEMERDKKYRDGRKDDTRWKRREKNIVIISVV